MIRESFEILLCLLYFYETQSNRSFFLKRIPISWLGIQCYNLIQIFFNAYMSLIIIRSAPHFMSLLFIRESSSFDIFISDIYSMWRFVDWIDTAILISQQKTPSTLHLIHHGSMPLLCLVSTAFSGNFGSVLFSILLNSIIHTIMYLYYLLSSSFRFLQKWKYVLTKLQIVQFILIAFHTVVILCLDPYQPSVIPGIARLGYMVLMIVCFSLWYNKDKKKVVQTKTLKQQV